MASLNKFNDFVEQLGLEIHNLNTDVLKVALTNTQPVATNTVLGNITEIAANAFGYSSGGSTVANTAWSETSGTAKLVGDDLTFAATGGDFAPFQWAVLYNSTAALSNLIGWWEYPTSAITLLDGETFQVDYDPASIFTVT